jgi:hypothetical protein
MVDPEDAVPDLLRDIEDLRGEVARLTQALTEVRAHNRLARGYGLPNSVPTRVGRIADAALAGEELPAV